MSAKEVEAKVFGTPVPQVTRVALAYSGGLDSSLCIELLRRKYKVKDENIIPITIDVGQGKDEVEVSKQKARKLGIKMHLIDCKREFTENWLTKAIRANSDYEGYPVSTSMTRQLVARAVARKAVELGCDGLMEGSTGKGNDQYRMHNTFKIFAPKCTVLCPVRDFDLIRDEERQLCEAWGVPVDEQIAGGDDKTLWCRSIASGAIGLDQELPEDIWVWLKVPQKAPDKTEVVSITFEEGIPTKLGGKKMPLDKLIMDLNVVAGRSGIGYIDMFEDGIMDLKSREIYEAPAAHVILKLHHDLEQWCLTKDELEFKAIVDRKWAYLTYHGMWFHPLKAELDAFVLAASRFMNGTYKVGLYKGNIQILKRESPTGLFSPEIRSIKSKGFSQKMAKDAATIRGIPFEILARRGGIEG
ncbi:MAG: argininosuccinate synthase [Planctomycetes bacterium]|nr:argininosuccinate synthase [Planctomycetota bacterium]